MILKKRKCAVVTGAGRGIGREVALCLAEKGYQVYICSRTEEELRETVLLGQNFDGNIDYRTMDVSNEKQVEAFFAFILEQEKSINCLINNAGLILNCPITSTSWENFQKIINTNLGGTFLCSRAMFSQAETEGACIVNVSSLAGIRGVEKFPGFAAYTAAKSAVSGLTEALAAEGKEYGIRVNAVAPGAVNTKMLKEAAPGLISNTEPKKIAEIITFLVEDSSQAMTGSILDVFCNG